MNDFRKICDGVFKCEGGNGPPTVELEGKEFHRIMNFFYINVQADELTREQVSALCHARAEEPRCFGGANQIIKSLFKSFLTGQQARQVLEVGAGSNPILKANESEPLNITYITSDADNDYKGDVVCFDDESELPYPSDHFDIVIALFVLHFKFFTHQIFQIYQHLKSDGIFLANVYNRSDESRVQLKRDFEDAGFEVDLIKDPKEHCRNHYYLLAGKDAQQINLYKEYLIQLINTSNN